MGQHHIRNYYEMPKVDLIAISDPADSALELATKYSAKYYQNYTDMLEDSELDAVSIAVPTFLHHEVASEIISRGIHTLLEKPIARTPKEAMKLVQLAKKKGVVLTIGHIERYNPVVAELKRIIDSGRIGDITSIISQRLGGFPKNEPETDVILDLAVHDIDIMSYLVGHSGEIMAAHGTNTFHSTETDSAEILLHFNGISGFIQANWVSPVKIRQISISGSKGYITANYITQEITFYEHMAIRTQDNFEDFVRELGQPITNVIKVPRVEPLRRELDAFTLAASGQPPEMLVSPVDAIAALSLALQAVENIKDKQSLQKI